MVKQYILLLLTFLLLGNGPIDKRPNCNGEIIDHTYFTLCYIEKYEIPSWVYYELTKEEVETKVINRTNNFREDLKVSTRSSHPNDYKYSGYDRGHLAPAADMNFTEIAMNNSFYMSNMIPQHPDLNRKEWMKLEEFTRQLAIDNESILIYTGPVILHEPIKYIGHNNVAVFNFNYKLIVNKENKCKGFVMTNSDTKPFLNYQMDCNFINYVLKLGLNDFSFWF